MIVEGRRIAVAAQPGKGPPVIFLGGFRSDMTGTKAEALSRWAARTGRAFWRFDYSGHGASEGRFEDLCLSDWLADAGAVLDAAGGRALLVGSSMGGWIALLLARARPEAVAGLVTIAAAPDFTEDLMWAQWDDATRARLIAEGRVTEPSDYGDPYTITRRLIEDGRHQLILRAPLHLPMPVRMLQGGADTDVPPAHALRLFDHAQGPDIALTLVKGADHRFSTEADLARIERSLTELLTP